MSGMSGEDPGAAALEEQMALVSGHLGPRHTQVGASDDLLPSVYVTSEA